VTNAAQTTGHAIHSTRRRSTAGASANVATAISAAGCSVWLSIVCPDRKSEKVLALNEYIKNTEWQAAVIIPGTVDFAASIVRRIRADASSHPLTQRLHMW
jgi:hypothetical protein